MEPINLDKFGGILEDGRETYRLLSLLTELESAGVTELSVGRLLVLEYLERKFLNKRRKMTPEQKEAAREEKKHRAREARGSSLKPDRTHTACPSCGSAKWVSIFSPEDNMWIEQCSKCRFSIITGDNYAPYASGEL